MSVWRYHQEHPLETVALLTPLQTESLAIGMRSSDNELQKKVNAFLKKFRTEQGFKKLGDCYLKEQKEALTQQGIPFYF